MGYGFCRGCGEQILWITTVKGKSMPCDPHIIPYWDNPKGKATIITPDGHTVKADLTGDYSQASGMGYQPHWPVCRERSRFKK